MVLWEPVKIVFIKKRLVLGSEQVTFSCYFTHLIAYLQYVYICWFDLIEW